MLNVHILDAHWQHCYGGNAANTANMYDVCIIKLILDFIDIDRILNVCSALVVCCGRRP